MKKNVDQHLAIDGHWTSWTTWGSCSVRCGCGTKKRKSTCTNPAPSGYGRASIGNSEDKDICDMIGCPCMHFKDIFKVLKNCF
jgi:hypothetical protein